MKITTQMVKKATGIAFVSAFMLFGTLAVTPAAAQWTTGWATTGYLTTTRATTMERTTYPSTMVERTTARATTETTTNTTTRATTMERTTYPSTTAERTTVRATTETTTPATTTNTTTAATTMERTTYPFTTAERTTAEVTTETTTPSGGSETTTPATTTPETTTCNCEAVINNSGAHGCSEDVAKKCCSDAGGVMDNGMCCIGCGTTPIETVTTTPETITTTCDMQDKECCEANGGEPRSVETGFACCKDGEVIGGIDIGSGSDVCKETTTSCEEIT